MFRITIKGQESLLGRLWPLGLMFDTPALQHFACEDLQCQDRTGTVASSVISAAFFFHSPVISVHVPLTFLTDHSQISKCHPLVHCWPHLETRNILSMILLGYQHSFLQFQVISSFHSGEKENFHLLQYFPVLTTPFLNCFPRWSSNCNKLIN